MQVAKRTHKGGWYRLKWLLLCTLLPLTSQAAIGPPPVIDVQPLNQTVLKGTSATFLVSAISGTTMTYQWKRNGSAISGATQSIYILNNAMFSATYTVDVMNASGTVTSSNAYLTVLKAPDAANDSYSTLQDHTLTVAAPGVLANDGDPNHLALTALLNQSPTNGILTLNLDGSFIYVPNPGYYGPDNFSYLANNGFFSSLVTRVSINVTQIIDQPLTVSIVGMTTNGCNLQLSGPAPATYVIFASPDLQNWTPVSTNAITTGKLSFTDTAATNYPNCFYKAVARKSW